MADNPRRYHAPRRIARAGETRARILAAAYDLFCRRGFAATIREVAEVAGVSTATVELAFGTKASLLDAVVDVTLAGDDEPVPVLQRGWVSDLTGADAPTVVDAYAAAIAAGAARVSPLLRALDQGLGRDPGLTALDDRLRRQRTVMATWIVTQVTDRGALAADLTPAEAVETVLVLIDPPLQRRLLVEREWDPDRLARWLSRSLRRLLLDGRA